MTDQVELTKADWQACKVAAIQSIRNCKAQLVVYENQLVVANRELEKFPDEAAKQAIENLKDGSAEVTA